MANIAIQSGNIFGGGVNGSVLTVAGTVSSGSNRVLVWIRTWGTANDPTSITWNGTALTKYQDQTATPPDPRVSIYYLVAPEVGSFNLVDTQNQSVRHAGVGVVFDNVDQTTPFEAFAGAIAATVNITTLAANAWPFAACGSNNTDAIAGSGLTIEGQFQNVYRSAFLDFASVKATPGTYTLDFTNGTTPVILAASLNPSDVSITITVNDQLNITESISPILIHNISVFDQLNITETVAMIIASNIFVFDQLTITESVTIDAATFFINVLDQLNITDVLTVSRFQETELISVSDQITITENVTKEFVESAKGYTRLRGADQQYPVTMTNSWNEKMRGLDQEYPLGMNKT